MREEGQESLLETHQDWTEEGTALLANGTHF